MLREFLAAGIILVIYFLFSIINKKGVRGQDYFLCSWMFILGLSFLNIYFDTVGLYKSFPKLSIWAIGLGSLYGPIIYFYVRSLTTTFKKLSRKDIIHFILPVSQYLLVIFKFMTTNNMKLSNFIGLYVNITNLIFITIYLGLSYLLLKKYKDEFNQCYSEAEKYNLKWITVILISIFISVIFSALIFVFWKVYSIEIDNMLHYLVAIPVVFVFILGVYGTKHKELEIYISNQGNDNRRAQKQSNNLNENSIQKVDNLFNDSKPFLDPDLNIQKLASLCKVPINELSFILNNHYKQSFFDFINSKRVKEVQKRIEKGDIENFTMLSIALDCGFNSKSSFNRLFKKYTNLTPSQYKDSIK